MGENTRRIYGDKDHVIPYYLGKHKNTYGVIIDYLKDSNKHALISTIE